MDLSIQDANATALCEALKLKLQEGENGGTVDSKGTTMISPKDAQEIMDLLSQFAELGVKEGEAVSDGDEGAILYASGNNRPNGRGKYFDGTSVAWGAGWAALGGGAASAGWSVVGATVLAYGRLAYDYFSAWNNNSYYRHNRK